MRILDQDLADRSNRLIAQFIDSFVGVFPLILSPILNSKY